jgi:NTE family protein
LTGSRGLPGSPDAGVNDGLAAPVSFDARYGAGHRRSLVLGGGGVVFVSWLSAYLGGLARRGVALDDADRIVGTSAGSILAAVVAGGQLERFGRLIRAVGRSPAVISRLAPSTDLKPSQQRALDRFERARDAEPDTIRTIGAAALAAAAPPRNLLPAGVLLMLQTWRWPDDRLAVTAVDTYSAERLVLTRASRTPLLRAVAASASVPGLYAPQPVLDRRAMDGGVSGTGTHADLVAGSERALVFPVAGTLLEPRLTMNPQSTELEIAALRAAGTLVEVRHTRLPPSTNLMDPAAVPAALALGTRQAEEDADILRDFWRG